jgi:lipid-A-disaccharide synthase
MIGGGDELLVVAGEASGDLHGARLLAELRRLVPGLGAFGLGGGELRAAGLEAVADSSEVAVVGFVEVLKVLPRVREVFAALLAEVDLRRPRAAVLIDFPDFNLRLARQLKRRGIPVIYYISPQVWAWRRGRVRTIARRVDQMLVLFPFEVELYRSAGVPAVHVGHPLVDEVPLLASAWDRAPAPGEPLRLALLPGSRRGEIEALLPAMLAAAARLAAELPIAVSLIRAPAIPEEMVAAHLAAFAAGAGAGGAGDAVAGGAVAGGAVAGGAVAAARGAGGLPVRVVSEERFAAIADSHLALCASGTATLEVGLLGTPMVVVYRLASWTYLLARLLVRLPNFALVNLVLGREVVPELLQGAAEPERIAAEALRLLADPQARERQRAGLAELRPRLGEGGASARAARQVAALLARTAGGGREEDGAQEAGGAQDHGGAQEAGGALEGRTPA